MKFRALALTGADGRDMPRLDRRGLIGLAVSGLSLASGCSTLERGAPMPPAVADQVTVLGIQNGRFWPDTQGEALLREGVQALERERAAARITGSSSGGSTVNLSPANFLAVSGGGDDGAFGAGLICGWSDSGKMPTSKLVTGVSTGSMIAPFAFLGGPISVASVRCIRRSSRRIFRKMQVCLERSSVKRSRIQNHSPD